MEQLYTIRETAKITGLSEGAIRNEISKGGIMALKVFETTRLPQTEISRLEKI